MKRTIYAFVDEDRREAGDRTSIVMDGVEALSFKAAPKTLFSNEGVWEPETWTVALDPKSAAYKKIDNLQFENSSRDAWYALTFEPAGSSNADGSLRPLRALPDAAPSRVKVTDLRIVTNSRTRNKLNRFSRLQGAPRTTKAEIKTLLDRAVSNIRNPMIAVYDVGQANWNALVDTSNCPVSPPKVHLFFDLGAPTGWNYKTLPTPPLDPLTSPTVLPGAPVILSHWDLDHWAGAAQGQPLYGSRSGIHWDERAIKDRKWLVPNQGRASSGQRITPTSWRLALALYRRGNLMIWPTLMNSVQSSRGDWLVKCVPTTNATSNNNNTGLAFAACLDEEWDGYTLCPADAEFSSVFVHLPPSLRFFHLIASHHGGNLTNPGSIPRPQNRKRARLAISHGGRHGHPKPAAKAAYTAKGWGVQYETKTRLPRAGSPNSGTIALPGWPSNFARHCSTCTCRIDTCPAQ